MSIRPATTRDDEDAAVVLTILAALATPNGTPSDSEAVGSPSATSAWGQPAHRWGVRRPGPGQWWASGLPR